MILWIDMDDFWGAVIILIIVLSVLVALTVRGAAYHNRHKVTTHKKMAYDSGNFKSGDVVLFIAHVHGFTNSIFTNDIYSHGGVVVEDGTGALHVSESVPGEGSRLTPLQTHLAEYAGGTFHMALEAPLDLWQIEYLWRLAQKKTPYPGFAQILAGLAGARPRKARHCMQHVAWLLGKTGIAPPSLRATGFLGSSRAVSTLSGKTLPGGNFYREVVEVVI